MRVLKRYKIENKASLIFAKRELSNIVDDNIFSFALMELGTNILKYPKKGEIWILEENNKFAIAACDKGCGIEDINWALKEGTTTSKSSLGIGLNRLSNNNQANFYIFSKKDFGTVVIFSQIECKDFCFLSIPLQKENGDFLAKKGKFLIFGDVSGHGKVAKKSADFIINEFFNTTLSCTFINDFLRDLHHKIHQLGYRGAVLSIVEISKKYYNICGVGNIGVLINKKLQSLKDGIIGVSFSSSKKLTIKRPARVMLFSDGIDSRLIKFLDIDEPILMAVSSCFFSDIIDDKSILILRS